MRAFALSFFALALPAVAAAEAPRTFSELANLIVILLDNATAVLIVAGLAIYFYGVATNILKMSESGGQALRQYLLWGVIVLFVMVSIWGIVRILRDTLFSDAQYGTNTPIQTQGTNASFTGAPEYDE